LNTTFQIHTDVKVQTAARNGSRVLS
jgi:hypothetical protein